MATSTHREVERTFEVAQDAVVPPLLAVAGVASVAAPVVHELEATYFDTPGLRLAARRITLRRRTGGDDAGWHVKLPVSADEKSELRRPLGRSTRTVPAAVLAPVRVHVRDEPVAPVATIANRRVVHRLLDADGAVLAEVCDDAVTAEALGRRPGRTRWREWEVELVGGASRLLDEVQALLLTAGATPSAAPSKLLRALDFRLPERQQPQRERLPRNCTAADAVLHTVHGQVEALLRLDPLVRADEPDAVHQMRVTIRKLRSALATYRPVLERAGTDPLREQLRWLGGVLGAARDAEVVRASCGALVAEQPSGLMLGPVARRLDRTLAQTYRTEHRQVVAALDGTRWFRLLDALEALLADPPLTDLAGKPATEVLPDCVRRDWKRLRHSRIIAEQAATPEERLVLRHDVRKAAKRLRYAAESAEGVCGKAAARLAKAAKGVQSVLGEQQDAAVTRQVLRDVAAQAHEQGETTFSYGRLDALVEAAGAESAARYVQVWAALDRARLRRWLGG